VVINGVNMNFEQYKKEIMRVSKYISNEISPHKNEQIFEVAKSIFDLSEKLDGIVVECGSYKGISSAKLSLACHEVRKQFYVCDSFCGLPVHNEFNSIKRFIGTLEEVKKNIQLFGRISVCHFIEGYYEKSLPEFVQYCKAKKIKIMVLFLDVDLGSSTETCLKYLYPLMVQHGVIYSQDIRFPKVWEVFLSNSFWKSKLNINRPELSIAKTALIKLVKK